MAYNPYGQQQGGYGQQGHNPYGQQQQQGYGQQPGYGGQQPGHNPYGTQQQAYGTQQQAHNPYGGAQQSHNPYGGGAAAGGYHPPAGGQNQFATQSQAAHNAWYAQYYNQIQQAELQKLQAWFASVDTDRSGSITAHELQKVTFGGFPLGLDIALKLVKVFDKDRSGTIDFFEYASMHQFITLMQRSFTNADRDRSGTLDYREIHTALQSSGFTIGLAPTQLFFNKVSRGSAHINFPQFLQLGADIALLRSKFEWSDTDKDGVIHVNFSQLLEICADL